MFFGNQSNVPGYQRYLSVTKDILRLPKISFGYQKISFGYRRYVPRLPKICSSVTKDMFSVTVPQSGNSPVTVTQSGNSPVTVPRGRQEQHRAGASIRLRIARRTEADRREARMESFVLEDEATTHWALQAQCWRPRLAADCFRP